MKPTTKIPWRFLQKQPSWELKSNITLIILEMDLSCMIGLEKKSPYKVYTDVQVMEKLASVVH